jgi:hypothetical protein
VQLPAGQAIAEHGAAMRRLRIGIVNSSAIAKHPSHRMDATYWLDAIETIEYENRWLHLLGEPEIPAPGRLL